MSHLDDYLESIQREGDSDDYQEHLVDVLQRMVRRVIHRISSPSYCTGKAPVIRRRPDLTVFKNTILYREIKFLSGLPPDNRSPNDRWSLQKRLIDRERGIGPKPAGIFTENQCRQIANTFIPNHKQQRLMSLESKVFISTFNKSGTRLITASQDNIIRVFDSSKGTYHRINRILARDVSWCILDIDYSPDGEYFVYSTWSDYLHISRIHGPKDDFQWLNLNPDHNRSCIFAVRFSPCGNFLVGAANDGCLYIYDRVADRRTRKIKTDPDNYTDVNALGAVDPASNIFVSGCENGIVKMWDLRTGNQDTPVGIFVGHFDAITYIDPRNDGRYFLTNSKDQSIKIWDMRRFSPREKEHLARNSRAYTWDYRWDNVPTDFFNPSKDMDGDSSIMTFRGHRVTKSLIRAKFSPLEQTGQRYIYTGCGTGRVIIYDALTGRIQETIEGHRDVVRDLAWHPVRSEIVSSSWDSHVNLNTYKYTENKRARGEEERPLRRSRRIANRNASQRMDSDIEFDY